MHSTRYALLLITLVLALSACGRLPTEISPSAAPLPPTQQLATPAPMLGAGARQESLGEPFTLGVGATAFVDLSDQQGAASALQVRVASVRDDSRCPRLVMCVQAGDATVIVVAQLAGRPPETLALHTSPQPGGLARAYGAYAVQLAALDPLRNHPEDAIDPASYRAQLVVTRGVDESPLPAPTFRPTEQAAADLDLDACSLLEPDLVAAWLGPPMAPPQPDATPAGGGQQCVSTAERGVLTIALYAGDQARAQALIAELSQGGAPLTDVNESPISLEAFGQGEGQAALLKLFGDHILVAVVSFAAQAQPAELNRAHEQLSTLAIIALTRYAAGQTTQRTTLTPAPSAGPPGTIPPDVTVIVN